MAGRRPVPTPLKLIRGNPGKRPIPENEVQPKEIEPHMPSDMDPLARQEWKRLAPTLVRLGLLTEVDGMAFAALCTAQATLRRIQKELRKCKYSILAEKHSFLEQKSGEGRSNEVMAVELKINPLFKEQRLALQTLRFWAGEFGLSASARGRIKIQGKKEVDPQEDFLNGR